MIRKVFLTLLLALPLVSAVAQTDFAKGWKEVDKLYTNEDYNKAYSKASKLFNEAKRLGDSRNTLTGAFHLARISAEYQEDVADSILTRYLGIVDKLDAVDKALCHAFIARFYYLYYKWNSYTIVYKNKETDEDELDYKLWPGKRFEQEIAKHNALALEAKEIMQKTAIESVEVFCKKPDNEGFNTTPTLYDLVMNMAIESEENPSERLRMVDELIAFHRNDDECLQIWLDLKKLELESKIANGNAVTSETYIQHAESYNGGCDLVTEFYLNAANILYTEQRYVEAKACCDKAVAMYPKSSGGVECANLINKIVHPECLILIDNEEQMADHAILAVATHRNVDAVYYRVVKEFKSKAPEWDNENYIKELLEQPVVKQWKQAVERTADYKEQRLYTYMPSLPTGEYILVASTSEDFKENGLSYGSFTCCDAMLVPALPDENALRGYLILRRNGEPVVGQKIKLVLVKWWKDYEDYKEKTIATTVTDKNGYYEFKNNYVGVGEDDFLSVQTTYKGLLLEADAEEFEKENLEKNVRAYCQLDRPVYKLGETVSFAYVVYSGDGHTTEKVCPRMRLDVSLHDVNGKTIDSARFTTDEFGMCHGEFKIPADALPGMFYLKAKHGKRGMEYTHLNVEEYKQPKFTVKMYGDKKRHSFGKELTVNGLAASYSQVPIDGAKVSYTVERSEMYRPWRWWYHPVYKKTTVAGGETVTDGEGRFEIRFTPMPDSSVELSNKPCFIYTVTADVTDLNGETHTQTHTLRVGYENSHISLPQGGEVDSFDSLRFSYCNLDGDPIDGNVSVQVYRLRQPQPRIAPELFGVLGDAKVSHTISREQFAELFGDLAYDRSDIDPTLWTEERQVLDKNIHVSKDLLRNTVSLGHLPAGTYRIKCRTVDSDGQSVESQNTYIYMPPDSKKVQSHSLIWTSANEQTHVGETYSLRIGSRFKGVKVIYILSKDSEVLDRRTIELNDNVKNIEIPIKDDYKGGVRVELFAIRENVVYQKTFTIDVPYDDKKLDITISSFRDKLQPGEKETWTIKVSEQQSAVSSQQPAASPSHRRSQITDHWSLTNAFPQSNLILTMYDAALDTYGHLHAALDPWQSNYNPIMLDFDSYATIIPCNDHQRRPVRNPVPPLNYNGWTLYGFLARSHLLYSKDSYAYGTARGEGGMVTMQGGVRKRTAKNATPELPELEECITVGTAESGVRMSDEGIVAFVGGVAESPRQADDGQSGDKTGSEPQLRSNLNTLAFFKPTLRTADDGTVECSFTVPDLLTEWSIRGVAHTKDMKTGSLSKSLITQKELMVQPNAPRFLRQGDTVDFMAKVVNMTDKEQTVTVTFDLTDASNSGQQAAGSRQRSAVSGQQSVITIPARRSEQVSFRVAVPKNIYVLNYRIIAKGDHFSDGEQDCLPVLTNRQMVTVSQAMYINGVGEKSYSLPALSSQPSESREPHLLKVEFTSNPIWYAIQALPYVEDHTNPSNIFLANRLYTNSVAFDIVSANPDIESVFHQWEKDTVNPLVSQLEKNEDVKQTLLDETPWLRDGNGETERMHRIAAYFDKSRLTSELKSTQKKLLEQQRPDGGWSWIPGSNTSSLYTTQYILETFGKLAVSSQRLAVSSQQSAVGGQQSAVFQFSIIKKALKYVDDETYDYYRRYLKHTDFEALNIDYLYMRSFYTDSEFKIQNPKHKESYDYFYRNTLKHYKEYKSLHTRATLALVFHRGGNSKEALDILRRIKESALYSDEMGMYWRDNQSSRWWYERPIETQALLIQAFAEITPDDLETIGKMQQWLLKQKQSTSWNTDVATVEAINALLAVGGQQSAVSSQPLEVAVAGQPMTVPSQAGTGYQSQSWHREEITQLLGGQQPAVSSQQSAGSSQSSQVTIKKYTDGIAWGAAYYQYFDDMKNIERSDMGVKISKTIYRVKTDGTLEAIPSGQQSAGSSRQSAGSSQQLAVGSQQSEDNSQLNNLTTSQLSVGDRVRIRILIDCDRALEYVELKDGRPGCLEPVSTASGWHWNSGLSYYSAVRNASNSFYINRLDKGKYIVEYDLFVTNPGTFTVPASTIQCLYAPEFRANSEGRTLRVE